MRWLTSFSIPIIASIVGLSAANAESPTIVILSDGIQIHVDSTAASVTSRVAGPAEVLATRGTVAKAASGRVADGHYRYELDMLPATRTRTADEFEADQYAKAPVMGKRLSGGFSVADGQLVNASKNETKSASVPAMVADELRSRAGVHQ